MWGQLAGAALGAGLGYLGNQGQSPTTQTGQVSSYIPAPGIDAPLWNYYAQSAQDLAQAGPTPYFPGQGYVGPSAPTQQGIDAIMQGAGAMPQFLQQASGNLGFLSNAADVANNPYVQNQLTANENAVTQALTEKWLPHVNQGAQAHGMMGSSRQGLLQAEAMERAAGQLANQNAQTMLNAYGQGLGAQQFALGQTGSMLNNLLMPGQAMLGAGQQVEGYQERALQDQMNRWNHQWNAPWQHMQNVGNTLQQLQPLGTQYGQATQPNPNYQNPWQSAIGGGMIGADLGRQFGGMFGSMFGGG